MLDCHFVLDVRDGNGVQKKGLWVAFVFPLFF